MPDGPDILSRALASAFLAGDWDPPAMARRGRRAIDQRRVWVRDLAEATRRAYPDPPRDRPRELARFLAACPPLLRALDRSPEGVAAVRWFPAETAMASSPWPVATLDTVADLGDLLGLAPTRLRWFADATSQERRAPDQRLRHYRYRWVLKAHGGARLIEAPKPVLRHVQRVLLREVLDHVPVHDAAHGFRKGRSAVTYAAAHTGRAVVIHLDLEDFFGSVTAPRVYGIYRRCGYPEPVAHLLTALATNAVPAEVLAACPRPGADPDRRVRRHLAHPHLPQGAPTSPALANLAARRLDVRLDGLARRAGLVYTRYADDLALSSATPLLPADRIAGIVTLVGRIAHEEGFRLHEAKTSVRRAGQRQRLAGVVVNAKPNAARSEYDLLNAILTNAARHGAASQNRTGHPHFRDHLLGRIAWVQHLNADRGLRLRRKLDAIDWADPS